MKMKSLPTELPTLTIGNKEKENSIKALLRPLILDSDVRGRIKAVFVDEMSRGLSAQPGRPSSLQMENTYINQLTDGTEEGSYLALDLGGTNFRVMLIRFEEGRVAEEEVAYYTIPKETFLGEGAHLFDFIANCIADFMRRKAISNRHYDLGFTFSFPMIQKGVNVGILTTWTKSFNCPGVVGKNVVELLNEAIKRNTDLDITVTCILNDTTGTLVQGSYLDKRCAIGMILGTGNNACYLEKVSNIPKWNGKHEEEEAVVDTEWGAFGDNGVLDFLRTSWDDAVDEKSLLPKSFTFEKYVAGKYLGDVVREVMVTLAAEGLLGGGGSTAALEVHGAIGTEDVARVDGESFEGGTAATRSVASGLGLGGASEVDVAVMQFVCGVVSYRSAVLVSLLTAILVDRMDRPHCTIAIDGSLFEHHPRFRPLMEHLIHAYSQQKSFSLLLTKDGSGKGAGLVAAVEGRARDAKGRRCDAAAAAQH